MAIYNINRNANLEIEQDVIRYRVPLIEYATDDINEIEKDLKRKVNKLNQDPHYLTPFRVEIINSSVIYYYDAKGLKSYLFLRGLEFEEKLKYFSSLVQVAKNKETRVLWNKYNFVLDTFEETVKSIVFETDYIKLHDDTNVLEGIKELILISLTTLDSIVGKPRKVNFIDQDDKIIDFAETVLLKIDDIDDLDDYINTKIIEYEHGIDGNKVEATEELENQPSKKKLFNKQKATNKKKTSSKPQKNTSGSFGKKSKGKTSPKQIILYGGFGVLIVIGIILNSIDVTGSADSKDGEKETIEVVQEKGNKKNDDDANVKLTDIGSTEFDSQLLLAYRESLTGNKQEAIKVLEGIGYSNLPNPDKEIMLKIYEELKSYAKVISLNPNKAEKIVNIMIADNNTNGIIELQEKLDIENPYINFEVAYLERDFETVINLKDQVELNGRKEKQIMESYIQLQKIDEAEQFAETVGNPDLMQMIQSYN